MKCIWLLLFFTVALCIVDTNARPQRRLSAKEQMDAYRRFVAFSHGNTKERKNNSFKSKGNLDDLQNNVIFQEYMKHVGISGTHPKESI